MSRLSLPSVTLVAIDTRLPDIALAAMWRCMHDIDFGEALAFVPHGFSAGPPSGIRLKHIEDIGSSEAYSQFVIERLPDFIRTDFVLIVQWDGFVTRWDRWSDSFFQYDYIGAPWPQFKDGHDVGNGGFSLRSSKLMSAVRQLAPARMHPEDVCICRDHREELERRFGVKFAPRWLARQFSTEREGHASESFGVHGLSNLVDAMPRQELGPFLEALPSQVFASTECRRLIKKLLDNGLIELAHAALTRREAILGHGLANARLRARVWLAYVRFGWSAASVNKKGRQ